MLIIANSLTNFLTCIRKMGDISIEEARARMIAKRFGGNKDGASTGGAGTARRKMKAAHKTTGGGIEELKT